MKKLLLLTCVAFMSLMASAQVTWNAKAGAGYGRGFCAKVGVGPEIHLSDKWSIMPTLEGAYKYVDSDFDGANCWYVQIPVNAAYRITLSDAMNMKIKVGPYFAYMVDDRTPSFLDTKKFDAGLDIGIDFEVRHFVFGVEAEYGFITPGESDKFDVANNIAFYATIGWRF